MFAATTPDDDIFLYRVIIVAVFLDGRDFACHIFTMVDLQPNGWHLAPKGFINQINPVLYNEDTAVSLKVSSVLRHKKRSHTPEKKQEQAPQPPLNDPYNANSTCHETCHGFGISKSDCSASKPSREHGLSRNTPCQDRLPPQASRPLPLSRENTACHEVYYPKLDIRQQVSPIPAPRFYANSACYEVHHPALDIFHP